MDALLDLLVASKTTAKFIATKLCRRFISDTPPVSAVTAVADAFASSSGDIRTTLRAFFKTPEFHNTRKSKLKRPLHWLVSALRALGADSLCGGGVQKFLKRAGQMPFDYPTPDGYADTSTAWESSLLARWDAALKMIGGKMPDVKSNPSGFLKSAGGKAAAARHFLGRLPKAHELEAFQMVTEDAEYLSLLLTCPEFQLY